MHNGLNRFVIYFKKVDLLLKEAKKQKDPALWLFKNNARTPFFMLEGLAKLYIGLHNKKKFTKLKEQFKLIEDGLGQVDYYFALREAFTSNKQIPQACKLYIKKQLTNKLKHLNEVLVEKDWFNGKRINKITKKLQEADWLKPEDEIEAITAFYGESIYSINEFVSETNYHFDNIEEDVHELRRKLRWLSIYPQALLGCIQFTKDEKKTPHLKKYLTNEIINSPYNQFPDVGENTSILLLQKPYFLSLSWIIAELGNLKDEGLMVVGLKEAISQTAASAQEDALKDAYRILGKKQRHIQTILDEAEVITKTFFTENNLEHLIASKARIPT